MEPITLIAAALASSVIRERFEKAGEQLGTASVESAQRLVSILKQRYPEFLTEDLGERMSYRETLTRIETAVEEDSEVAQAVVEVGEAVKSESDKDAIFKILSDVISNLQDSPNQVYNVQYNIRNKDDIDGVPFISKDDHLQFSYRRKPDSMAPTVRIKSLTYSLYMSIFYLLSSLLLIGFLVFVPLSIGIQQLLVALIALLFLFSFSSFRGSARGLTQ